MRGIATLWIIGLLLVGGILIFSGQALRGIASILPTASVVSFEGENCVLIKPQFGRIACEPLVHTGVTETHELPDKDAFDTDVPTGPTGAWKKITLKCGDAEYTPECSYSMSWTGETSSPAGWFYYKTSTTGGWVKVAEQPSMNAEISLATIPIGQEITIAGIRGFSTNRIYAYESFVPYGLNVYDSGGKYRYNAKSCDLNGVADKDKVVKSCEGLSGCDRVRDVAIDTQLTFDDWVNYLADYDMVPIDESRRVVNYNGKTVFCQVTTGGANLYELNRLETNEGVCYVAPANNPIAGPVDGIECCPGSACSANGVCNDDFKCVANILPPEEPDDPASLCTSDQDCIVKYGTDYICNTATGDCVFRVDCRSALECGQGTGTWETDYSTPDTDVVKWSCVNYRCVITERKSVQCTPPNIGCADGYVCNPTTFTCELQTGPAIKCGDGVCSKPYEDYFNCPEDCDPEPTERSAWDRFMSFLGIFAAGLIISGFILAILLFVTPLKFLLKDYKMLIGIWLGLALVLSFIFAIPLGIFAASIIGGI
jgi:hypothetical protein